MGQSGPQPFAGFEALDGCHCITNSLAKVYRFHGHALSEEMLFGLGAGIGFIYWQMNLGGQEMIFVGGRGNPKAFYADIAKRTGVAIAERHSASAAKAEAELVRRLGEGEPVVLGGDMAYLPWFDFPPDYHFGGHAFVACGYDGRDTVLASDMEPHAAGVKKGFFAPITLAALRQARNSPFKPFPPKNFWLDLAFDRFHAPRRDDILAAIRQAAVAMLHPPISNIGVAGMRRTAAEIRKWPKKFDDATLRRHLFDLYVSIEIGGTGGGCFRALYARFLAEAAAITGSDVLTQAADAFAAIGADFSALGRPFKDAATMADTSAAVEMASNGFARIAESEEMAWRSLEAL